MTKKEIYEICKTASTMECCLCKKWDFVVPVLDDNKYEEETKYWICEKCFFEGKQYE